MFIDSADVSAAITSITRTSNTATVTTTSAHGLSTNDWVTISSAVETDYNGRFKITKTGASTFTYTVANTPSTPATGTITFQRCYIKHYGKIWDIDPQAGDNTTQLAPIISYDNIREMAEIEARTVTVQISKTEAELLTALLDSADSVSQPVDRDFDTGVDTFPWAFYNVSGEVKMLSVIKDIADSALCLIAVKGDGTMILRSRHNRASGASVITFNNSMHGLDVPSSLDGVYNLVRVTVHPLAVSSGATDVLYELPAGASIPVIAGETIEFFVSYTDENDRQVDVGGTNIVTPLVANTHFAFNTQADGLGSDISGDVSIYSIDPLGGDAKFTFKNNGSVTGYLVPPLKVIGDSIRDNGAYTAQASSVQTYGTRPFSMDMPYQSSSEIAKSAATYIEAQRSSLVDNLTEMTFLANDSASNMTQACAREVGDRITVTEPVTGITLVDAIINSVSLTVMAPAWVTCTWGLAPASPWSFLLWGTTNSCEWGETTIWGF